MIENKQNSGKKISIFYVLIGLIISAVIIAMYINNVINVNQLSSKNNELKQQLKEALQNNDGMRTEIEKMCTFDKINAAAIEKLHMKYDDSSIIKDRIIKIKKSELQ